MSYRDLYIAGAGIRPQSTVPICLDLGTNTQRFLDDPLYIGVRRKRPVGVEVSSQIDLLAYCHIPSNDILL